MECCGGVGRDAGFVHGFIHEFDPAVSGAEIDLKCSVAHPKSGVSAFFNIGGVCAYSE